MRNCAGAGARATGARVSRLGSHTGTPRYMFSNASSSALKRVMFSISFSYENSNYYDTDRSLSCQLEIAHDPTIHRAKRELSRVERRLMGKTMGFSLNPVKTRMNRGVL